MSVLAVSIVAAIGGWSSLLETGQPGATTQGGQSITVSGTLLRKDGTPVEGVKVMIAEAMPRHPEAKERPYQLLIADGGGLENPHAVTDPRGRFSITVPKALFKRLQEFVVVVPFFGRIGVAGGNIERDRSEYDVGEIRR